MRNLKLSIEDPSLAAWMTINNSFTKAKAAAGNHGIHGLLIQFGKYDHADGSGPIESFGAVLLKNGVQTVMTLKSFIWLNVAPAATPCMDKKHVKLLAILEEGKARLHGHINPYDGTGKVVDKPGIITCWTREPYTIQVNSQTRHPEYMFEFKEDLEVCVLGAENGSLDRISGITSIEAVQGEGYEGMFYHHIKEDPPWP